MASAAAQTADAEAVKRGEYLFNLGGCAACHTDVKNKGPLLAGGRALKTPFGTFYGPNITPDPQHGIGRWTEAQFIRAMREGVAADGSHLFPVFPYTSYTRMTDADLRDLRAYIYSLPPVAAPSKPHDVQFPYGLRWLQYGWKMLNFTAGAYRPDAAKSAEWNRGAYLVQAVGHCAECHTPRDGMGAARAGFAYAGTLTGPDDAKVPNITPDPDTGIGRWSDADLSDLLKYGTTPDGDSVGAAMGEVVNSATSKLNDADLRAMIVYLRSLPPVRNQIRSRSP